ncbi:hypothetical protein BGZ97_003498 [Linnemannia gamsii]|uniref:WD40 repeat-like protein n=1 Tax=Linnemannia gamsii TaxID=64522 RepID=A0A9P6QV11_9FUNG|nr:hypothetical protein BGZ97_003498 [Linnemannia gamsii]
MDLVKNPFLLMLSLEVLPAITEDKQDLTTFKVTRVQLYDTFVVHWLEVNQRRQESNALSMDDRNVFDQLLDAGFTSMGIDYSTRLALAIFDRQDGRPVVQYKDLHDSDSWKEEFFGPEPVTRLLQESSPLTRSGDQFWFIHRTMLEYFFSRVIYSPATMDNEFDPQAKNESFAAHAIGLGNPLFGYNLVAEPSIIQFLCDRVKLDAAFEQQLRSLIDQSKTDESATIAATNAITILVRADMSFHGVDLRGVKIPGADLSDGQFDSTQFQGADLRRVNLSRCWLRQADMSSARMEGVQFGELPYLEMDANVYTCAYSPDGGTLALGLGKGRDSMGIYDTSSWTETFRLRGAPAVLDVAFSPNGQVIVSGEETGMLRLRDCCSGQDISVLEGHNIFVRSVAFSPCGKQIASASHDKTVRLWDMQTGEIRFVLEGHTNFVTSVKYSPKGEQLVSGGWDETIRFWDPVTGEPRVVLRSSYAFVHCLVYSPDGQWVVSGHPLGELQFWNTVTYKVTLLSYMTAQVNRVTVSPDGRHIALLSTCHTIDLLDRPSGELLSSTTLEADNIQALVFSPASQQLAIGTNHGSVKLWNLDSDKPGVDLKGHVGGVDSIAYSPCGQWIASGSGDMSVKLWRRQQQANEAENWLCFSTIRGFIGSIHDIAWNPVVEMEFVTTCMDGSIRVWRVSSSDGGVVVKLHWGSRLGILCAADMILKSVIDLGPVNKKLLTQRGAISPLVNEQDD